MKKILPVFLFALLAGCGGSDNDASVTAGSGGEAAAGAEAGADGAQPGAPATDAAGGTADDSSGGGTGGEGASAGGGTDGAGGSQSGANQDSSFIIGQYQLGLGEIELSQVALQRASDENTRLYAERMLSHHQAMNAQLTALAQTLGVSLPATPAPDHAVRRQNLEALSGADFDRAYAAHNVALHQQALAQFRQLAGTLEAEASGDGGAQSAPTTSQQTTSQQSASDTGAQVTVETSASASLDGAIAPAPAAPTPTQTFAANALPALQVHLLAAKALAGTLDPAVFVANLYQDGLAEIALSQLALERAVDDGVRDYAQRMVDDHTQANQQLAEFAQTNNLSLPQEPSDEQRAVAQELALMAGDNFDKAYMNHNVLVHEIAVVQAEEQVERGLNGAATALAASLLPDLLVHREQARLLYESIRPGPLFVAAQSGMGEILLSQLALQLGEAPQVLDYARHMIDEHSAANAQVVQLARQHARELPGEVGAEHAQAYLALSQLRGAEFDRAFMEQNVLFHEQALQLLSDAQVGELLAQIREFAAGTSPLLQTHLENARTIVDQLQAAEPQTTPPGEQTGPAAR